LFVVAYVTAVVYWSIYGPQPLLLVLKSEFGVSEATVSLMITAVLVPLGFAPLFYGYLFGNVPAKKLLVTAVSLLALTDLGIFYFTEFWVVLGLRFAQGLIIPAILTALMTHVSRTHHDRDLQRAFSLYIASCIFGGVSGRVLSGGISTLFGWRYSFFALCIALIVGLVLLLRIPAAPKTQYERAPLGDILETLRRPLFLRVCVLIAFSFFVFVAISNYLPFRLTDITGGISEFRISMAYAGYIVGMISALYSPRLITLFEGEATTLLVALSGFLVVIFIFLSDSTVVVFVNMFLFCACMALVQAVCPGYINRLVLPNQKSVANGLYLSIYYAGGSLGSYLPGFIYTHFGWDYYIYSLAFVVLITLVLAWGLKERGRSGIPSSPEQN
jgi:YNFM family putative membrane transporter